MSRKTKHVIESGRITFERPWMYPKQYDAMYCDSRNSVIEAGTKSGKALADTEPVQTPGGEVPIGSLRVGDILFGEDGARTRVDGVYPQGEVECYNVTFSDGTTITASSDHIWTVFNKSGVRMNKTTRELVGIAESEIKRYSVPQITGMVTLAEKGPYEVAPYTLGVILAGGCITAGSVRISCKHKPAVDMASLVLQPGFSILHQHNMRTSYRLTADRKTRKTESIQAALRRMGLWGVSASEKRVPARYKYSAGRINVLRGFFDTRAYADPHGRPRVTIRSRQLAEDITWILRSMGIQARKRKHGNVYSVTVYGENPGRVFRTRKAAHNWNARPLRLRFKHIEYAGVQSATCIEVNHPSKLFACRNWVLTHNTTSAAIWLFEQSLQVPPHCEVWWIAPVYQQSRIAYSRMRRGIAKDNAHFDDNEMTIHTLVNTIIRFKSGEKPDNLYGEDVYAAVIDEFTRLREEAWHAVRSTLTKTRGPVRLIGNVKGKSNWGYKLARRAQAGLKGWEYHKITAFDAVDAGVLESEEIDDARRELPEDVFKELYLAEATEDGANPFGVEHIRACTMQNIASGEPVVFGWDLGRKLDYTVGVGLDSFGRVCRFTRFKKSWRETIGSIIEVSNGITAVVDDTGVGDPIVEKLMESGDNFSGFTFTSTSKQKLMEGLALAIQNREVAYPPGKIVEELEEFTFEHTRTGVRYTAPAGFHDDCVMALALAVRAKGSAAQNHMEAW